MVSFDQKWMYSSKVVVVGQNCCIRKKWLYLGKSGFIRAKLDIFVLSGCIRVKVVVFGQKWLY